MTNEFMVDPEDIRPILDNWEFDPQGPNVRMVTCGEREFLQMRIDLGLLQLETTGRPDGEFHTAIKLTSPICRLS